MVGPSFSQKLGHHRMQSVSLQHLIRLAYMPQQVAVAKQTCWDVGNRHMYLKLTEEKPVTLDPAQMRCDNDAAVINLTLFILI